MRESSRVQGKVRYAVLAVSLLSSAITLSCNFAFNFASVCRINATVPAKELYEESPTFSPIMYFDNSETRLIYTSYSTGVLIGLFGLRFLQNRSIRHQVFVGLVISALTTGVIPIMYGQYRMSVYFLKLVQGISVAPIIPIVGYIAANWTPRQQMGLFVSVMTSYSQIGIFFTMFTSGPVCEWFGWQAIFYLHALAAAGTAALWLVLFRDHPSEHPFIASEELEYIHGEKSETRAAPTRQNVPYRRMFKSLSFWAVIIAAVGNYNGISPLIVFSPMVLKKAVGLSDIATSRYNAVSFAMQLFLKIASGLMSDAWHTKETTKVRVFNTLSCGASGVLMIATAFIPAEHQLSCAVMITLTQAIIGFNSAGFNKAAVIVSRQHAHFTMTLLGIITAMSTIAEPFIVYWAAPDSSWAQWFWLFVAHGAVLIVSNLFFCLFVKAEPAEFTQAKKTPETQAMIDME